MVSRNSKIAIVGGGIGGLTAANCLLQAGFDVQVYEQSRLLSEVGAGINISPNASRILNRLGLAEECARVAYRSPFFHQRRWDDGRTLTKARLATDIEKEFGAPHHIFHRGELHALLARPVPRERVHLAHRFACRAYRGLIPVEKVRDIPPESTASLGPGRHFIHYFVSAGRMLNFVGHVEQEDWISESWTEPGKVSDLRAAYAGFHPQVQKVIDAVDETFIWAVLDRPPISRWTFGRITMLGDACHPMIPFMGQGGAQAIEDAAAITACLLKCGDDVEAALKLYETLRLPRASRVQNASWDNKTRFHMP